METVITIEHKELIRDGEFEMKTQIQDFLDSKVDEWKFSVTTHLWSDHYFRLLRRHFSLQLLETFGRFFQRTFSLIRFLDPRLMELIESKFDFSFEIK